MKIYRIALDPVVEFLSNFRPQSLKGLAAEALKCDNFQEFEHNYLGEIKHGTYWHITDNPNFSIDPLKGPRDMSSMSVGNMTPGALMVTSHLENWIPEYPDRKYVAEIDLSGVNKSDYYQVKRGFGNEFYIKNVSKVKVIRVIPIAQALRIDRYRHSKIPQNGESLELFFNSVKSQFGAFERDKFE
jgi:hypothetical protein